LETFLNAVGNEVSASGYAGDLETRDIFLEGSKAPR
jgi:hypothetical protein